MTDAKKKEITLTASGYEYDRDLVKVPIKVSPALQAVLANQLDLIEMIEKDGPEDPVFIAQHRSELLQVEEEIAGSFSKFIKKKEAEKERRTQKKEPTLTIPEWSPEDKGPSLKDTYPLGVDMEAQLDRMADKLSPGLPSAKYEERSRPVEKPVAVDVKRVALGASIKALSGFLGRDLTEKEISAIERQVESYL
ncbi:MAG: hypothetical protein ACYDEQ_14085 [Desulfocucumaceae bacterium]